MVGVGTVTSNNYVTAGGFDVGKCIIDTGDKKFTLHIMNEWMAVDDKNGNRITTYPDVITVLDKNTGLPLNVFEVLEGNEAYILKKELTAEKYLDVTDMQVLPGVIDAHVHSFSSMTEGFVNATRSAAAGGVTTIIEMPYDADGMINSVEAVQKKKDRIAGESLVDVALLATLRNSPDALADVKELAKQGVCGFKLSMFDTDPNRFPGISDGLLYEMFCEIAKTGLPVGIHAENDSIIRAYIKKYEGQGLNNPLAHCYSRPKVAEAAAVATALELARHSGVKLHIYHASYPQIFRQIDFYRNNNTDVTAETCPHYLLLSEGDMPELGAKAKINPPLRQKADSEGLWELLEAGKIDIVASDHAPWTMDRKNNPDIFKNTSGAPGVETLLPLVYSEGVMTGRINIHQLVKVLCENPARIFGLHERKGKIQEGFDADFAIINPKEKYVLDEKNLNSTAGWSPYNGLNLNGRVKCTILRGQVVYNNGVLSDKPAGNLISC